MVRLTELLPNIEVEVATKKTFKDAAPGFLHVDIKSLPQMSGENGRHDLFVAMDFATRWVFLRIATAQSGRSSTDFLHRLYQAALMNIIKLLTANGSQFTDRLPRKCKTPSGPHVFELVC